MLSHRCIPGLAAAICAILLAGCASGHLRGGAAAKTAPSPPAQPHRLDLDAKTEKLARAHAHFAAGYIYDMNQQPEAALQEYLQASLDDPENEELLLDVSRRLLQNKQPEKALEVLTRAALVPNASGAVFARLAVVYAQLGKLDQAAGAARTAIKRAPDSLAGYQNLFLISLQKKQSVEALKVLEEAAHRPNTDAEFLSGVTELYANFVLQFPSQKEQVKTRALSVLDRAVKLNPPSAKTILQLAEGYNLFGAGAKAAQMYLGLLKKLPDVPFVRQTVHARLADIYLRNSDHKAAREQLTAILHDDPTNPQVYYYLGRIAYEEKKPTEAAEHFSKAVVLNPDFEDAYCYLALAQIGANTPAEALDTLQKARSKFPPDFQLDICTALAYTRQKAYAEALKCYTDAEVRAKLTEPARLNHEFYFEVGAACERSGDYDRAEQYFQKCLQLKPDFAEALNYLGYMWAEHGLKLPQARELIEKALKIEPQNAAYLDSLGWVLFKLAQPQQALPYLLKAVELSKEPDPALFDHLGDIYAALRQVDKACEAWQKSLALEPNQDIRKKLEAASK